MSMATRAEGTKTPLSLSATAVGGLLHPATTRQAMTPRTRTATSLARHPAAEFAPRRRLHLDRVVESAIVRAARRRSRRTHHRRHPQPAALARPDAGIRRLPDRQGPELLGSARHPALRRLRRAP